jgi:hypothetical protein
MIHQEPIISGCAQGTMCSKEPHSLPPPGGAWGAPRTFTEAITWHVVTPVRMAVLSGSDAVLGSIPIVQ